MKTLLSILAGILMDLFIGVLFTGCIVLPIAYTDFNVTSFGTLLRIGLGSLVLVALISPFGSELVKGIRNEED